MEEVNMDVPLPGFEALINSLDSDTVIGEIDAQRLFTGMVVEAEHMIKYLVQNKRVHSRRLNELEERIHALEHQLSQRNAQQAPNGLL